LGGLRTFNLGDWRYLDGRDRPIADLTSESASIPKMGRVIHLIAI